MTTHQPDRISYVELVGVGTSDQHKPTYSELRADGMSEHAIETLMISRDALVTMPAAEVAEWIALSHQTYPLTVTDVWGPGGAPEHWEPCIVCDLVPALCTGGVCDCGPRPGHPDYDPTDADLQSSLMAEGWSERNAKVMAVVAGIESGEVAS